MSAYLNTAWVRQDLIALADSCPDQGRAARLRRMARQEAGDPPPPVMPAMPLGPRSTTRERHVPAPYWMRVAS